jgi:cyclopropane fatty-acyl-phospholipid synthase-like methyltransferase
MQERNFDREAATWDAEPRRVKLARDIVETIKAEIKLEPGMDIMDFGCGTGLVGLLLRPQVRSLTCVDNSQGMLDVLKGKAAHAGIDGVTTRLVDVSKGGELTGSYDCIVSAMALHHIRDIAGVARQLYQALREGGRIGIADLEQEQGKFHEDHSGVFHHGFERAQLSGIFAEAGFADIRFRRAAEVEKPSGKFPVFLMVGSKKDWRI